MDWVTTRSSVVVELLDITDARVQIAKQSKWEKLCFGRRLSFQGLSTLVPVDLCQDMLVCGYERNHSQDVN